MSDIIYNKIMHKLKYSEFRILHYNVKVLVTSFYTCTSVNSKTIALQFNKRKNEFEENYRALIRVERSNHSIRWMIIN